MFGLVGSFDVDEIVFEVDTEVDFNVEVEPEVDFKVEVVFEVVVVEDLTAPCEFAGNLDGGVAAFLVIGNFVCGSPVGGFMGVVLEFVDAEGLMLFIGVLIGIRRAFSIGFGGSGVDFGVIFVGIFAVGLFAIAIGLGVFGVGFVAFGVGFIVLGPGLIVFNVGFFIVLEAIGLEIPGLKLFVGFAIGLSGSVFCFLNEGREKRSLVA